MQAVTFDPPAVRDGTAPVAVTCTPASGTPFPLGSTSVNCAARDALSRQATCAFNVTLTAVIIEVTKYGAFGDSLTEGETGGAGIFRVLDPPNAYPTKLQLALDASFPGQGIVVINRGHSGDPVEDPAKEETTLNKIIKYVPIDRPGAVLLLSGYNNLTGPCGVGQADTPACRAAIDQVRFGIRDCLRRVREANAGVRYTFVSTLTPPGPTGSHRIDGSAIQQANDGIRKMAAAEGAVLVDSYSAFLGHEAEYVNVDGLHLRPAGYQAIADTFFAAIQATVPQTVLSLSAPH